MLRFILNTTSRTRQVIKMKRGLVIAGIIIFAGMLAGCGNKNTDVNHNNLNKDKG